MVRDAASVQTLDLDKLPAEADLRKALTAVARKCPRAGEGPAGRIVFRAHAV